jgi:hypothetical protein
MLEKILTAFFSQEYSSKKEMLLAYSLYNKKWTRHARKNKLNEKEFEEKSKQVLTKVKQNEDNK